MAVLEPELLWLVFHFEPPQPEINIAPKPPNSIRNVRRLRIPVSLPSEVERMLPASLPGVCSGLAGISSPFGSSPRGRSSYCGLTEVRAITRRSH